MPAARRRLPTTNGARSGLLLGARRLVLSGADPGLSGRALLRARNPRAIRHRAGRASLAEAGALPAGRPDDRRRAILLGRRRRNSRGRGRSGACRRHRARAFPLQLPRRAGAPPGNLARLPASRRRAGAARRARPAQRPSRRNRRRRHDGGARDRLLPVARRPCRRRVLAARQCAARRVARAGADRQPYRRSRGARRRCRLSAGRRLLRPAARRCAEPDRRIVRQPIRPRLDPARRRRARHRRRIASAS